MTRTWRIAPGILFLMLPVTTMVPLLHELTEGRHPGLPELDRHLFMSAHMAGALPARNPTPRCSCSWVLWRPWS